MVSRRPINCNTKTVFVPESTELALVLQDGLRKHFKEATVEWTDCPDLTQEPFNFVRPGLCGDGMLLQIGSYSNLFCQIPQMQMRYDFKEILKVVFNNYSSALIIGAGFALRQSTKQFGELIMNASFSQAMQDYLVCNQSRVVFMDLNGKFVFEPITDSNPACYMHGNFFITEGKPGKVLRVYAKKSLSNLPFSKVIYQVLNEKYSSPSSPVNTQLIGLGGTFLVKKRVATHHIMPSGNDQIETSENINNWLKYCNSSVGVGTIIINNNIYNNYLVYNGQKAYGLTEINFKPFSIDENFYMEPSDTLEFLGFFYPAHLFHHMDPQSTLLFECDS